MFMLVLLLSLYLMYFGLSETTACVLEMFWIRNYTHNNVIKCILYNVTL